MSRIPLVSPAPAAVAALAGATAPLGVLAVAAHGRLHACR